MSHKISHFDSINCLDCLLFVIIDPNVSLPSLSHPPPSLSLPLYLFTPFFHSNGPAAERGNYNVVSLSLVLSFTLSSSFWLLVMQLAFSADMIHSNHSHTHTKWTCMHKRNIDSRSDCLTLTNSGDCLVHSAGGVPLCY